MWFNLLIKTYASYGIAVLKLRGRSMIVSDGILIILKSMGLDCLNDNKSCVLKIFLRDSNQQ